MSPAIRDGLGLVASYAFVFGFIGVATLLVRRNRMQPAATRKVIHIGVAHWWLIAMALMDNPWVASVGPFSFIVINALAIRFHLLPAMDDGADGRNWGTVYFPLSLLVLVNLCWRAVLPTWIGGMAVLVLGWGDGLAALIGEGSDGPSFRIWGGRKSVAGTAAMFAASFVVALVFVLLFSSRYGTMLPAAGIAALVACVATAVELVTPLGIDNITVPLAVAGMAWALFA